MRREDGITCNELPPGITQEEVDKVAELSKMFVQLDQDSGKMVPVVLSGMQKLIFYSIIKRFPRYNHIMCTTRYGKSFVVSLALLLRLVMNPKEKWMVVAPTTAQASIIFNNIIEHLNDNDFFRQYLPSSFKDKADRLSHEQSKKRITFNNHSEIRVLSADADNKIGGGKALMGHGCICAGEKILTDEGYLLIDDVVKNKLNVKIASYNHDLGKIEYENINGYQENARSDRQIMELESSNGSKIKLTDDHPVYVANKGYVRADELIEGDEIIGI